MTDDHSFRPRPTSLSAAPAAGRLIAEPATAAYVEAGRPGDPASWRSAEYQQDWGGRMRADQAYAAGIDGQGVKIGEMDSGFDPSHPDTPRLALPAGDGQRHLCRRHAVQRQRRDERQ